LLDATRQRDNGSMSSIFRVVNISDRKEVHRSIDLVGSCVVWVKNPKKLRVEQLPTGGTVAEREVPASECCSALKAWLPTNRHFISDEERKDMAELIREACEGKPSSSSPTF